MRKRARRSTAVLCTAVTAAAMAAVLAGPAAAEPSDAVDVHAVGAFDEAVAAAEGVEPVGIELNPPTQAGTVINPPTQAGHAIDPPAAKPPVDQARTRQVNTREQRYLHLVMKSEQTLDLTGVEPSLYRGKFYRAGLETKRRCIVQRESNGHYFSISHNGYRGAYQMSAALARGVTWMMLPEHRVLLGDGLAREVLAALRQTPANRWPRYWQDAAFSTIHNWEYPGSGASHWYGGRWHC